MAASRRRVRRPITLAAALVALVVLLGTAAPAFAAPATYAQWRIGLWPEYDDQRTLVIYEPQVDPSVPLPFKFSYAGFPLDAQVGMTCQVTPAGNHECQQRQTSVVGDSETISYTAPGQRQLYMEYYTDMLGGKRPQQREMKYTFTAPADIADLQIAIKQPKDATNFTVTPKPVAQQTDSEGFTIDSFGMQNVKAGQKYTFTFTYSRPTWDPPVAKTQNGSGGQGGSPIAAGASGTQQGGASQTGQTFALVAVAAFLGAAVMLVLRRKPSVAAPVQAGPQKTSAKKAPAKKAPAKRASVAEAKKPGTAASSSKRSRSGGTRSPKPEPEA